MSRSGVLLIVIVCLAVALVTLGRDGMTRFLAGSFAPAAAPGEATDVAKPSPPPTERKESVETDHLYSFDYTYPPQAAAIPGLRADLERRITESKAKLEAEAKESRKEAKEGGYPFQPHYFDLAWTVAADLPDWLSLEASVQTYGGGAHPNHDFASLVWDRKAGRALDPLDLFVSADALDAALHVRYCAALDKERAERREQSIEEVRHDDIWACPGVADLALVLESKEGKGFDTLSLLAAPYIAGPYVEGSYETELPVDKAVLDAVRPEYREAFRAGR